MALRRALLIAPLVLALAGWAGSATKRSAGEGCGGCHVPHFVERGTCASCHRGDPLALRKEIAHHRLLTGRAAGHALPDAPETIEGRRHVDRLACRRCHVVGGTGNRLATNLDRVAWKREQGELARSISAPVENMPRFGLTPRQEEAVIAFLLGSADPDLPEATYRVRFSGAAAKAASAFESRCGGCHRALSVEGPLGRGSAGPNLSGLFSAFSPPTAPGNRAWTGNSLGKWLENPRSARALAAMRPVRLEPAELARVVRELGEPLPKVSSRGVPSPASVSVEEVRCVPPYRTIERAVSPTLPERVR